ncbi:hypothetical protein SAMN05920897_10492 [Alkalispirochaeta americana]|uniref:Uncharacterized protein n=1 Tax=Alkalispirochaeta americana TaxID=159291 RepID=A0A1N6QBC2_9SPIO|nr:hypothetical protein [Alkalispirochaeta americana]SIQ13845.1 hypothetical protein SAMN05920897_10492 [Alkalispirochaeta americana]
MTVDTIFLTLDSFGLGALVPFFLLPLLALGLGAVHGFYDGRRSPWCHCYALMVQVSTGAFAFLVALVVLYILRGGDLGDPGVPRVLLAFAGVSWVVTLLAVRRSVAYRYLASVKHPVFLVLFWALAWSAGGSLYLTGLWLIPGPPLYTALVMVFLVFFILELLLLMVTAKSRARR